MVRKWFASRPVSIALTALATSASARKQKPPSSVRKRRRQAIQCPLGSGNLRGKQRLNVVTVDEDALIGIPAAPTETVVCVEHRPSGVGLDARQGVPGRFIVEQQFDEAFRQRELEHLAVVSRRILAHEQVGQQRGRARLDVVIVGNRAEPPASATACQHDDAIAVVEQPAGGHQDLACAGEHVLLATIEHALLRDAPENRKGSGSRPRCGFNTANSTPQALRQGCATGIRVSGP